MGFNIHLEFRQYKFVLQVDAALVYAALRKSGLISNGCSGREIYLVGNRQTSGESASLPQYDEGTESAEVATSDLVGTGYNYPDLPGLGNNNEKLGLPERLSTGIQFRFRNIFHGKKIG